jgi:penicillin amidase
MRRDRPEPLIYTAWRRQVARSLAEDNLGPLFDEYWGLKDSRRALFVEVQLGVQSAWCDDVTTSTMRETCASRLGLSLDRALDEIAAMQGDVIEDWRWGDAHQATFRHPIFSKLPLLDRLSEIRIPSDGGDHTVNRGETRGGTAERPYEHFDGAGLRVVYDLADLDNSRFVIATGQSGNPLSAHYDDLLETGRDGTDLTIAPGGEQNALRTLVLTPLPRIWERAND